MSDLVERLRAGVCGDKCRVMDTRSGCICAEAATRIEQLEAALRAAYEVYAGSDGFIPETCAEGYQRQIITQMVDCISSALEDRT